MAAPADTTKTEQSNGGGSARYLRLVLLAALIGVPAASLAAVFLAAVNWLQHALWTDVPHALGLSSPPWYLVLGYPVVGGCPGIGVVVAVDLCPASSLRRLAGGRHRTGRS